MHLGFEISFSLAFSSFSKMLWWGRCCVCCFTEVRVVFLSLALRAVLGAPMAYSHTHTHCSISKQKITRDHVTDRAILKHLTKQPTYTQVWTEICPWRLCPVRYTVSIPKPGKRQKNCTENEKSQRNWLYLIVHLHLGALSQTPIHEISPAENQWQSELCKGQPFSSAGLGGTVKPRLVLWSSAKQN